MDRGSGGVGGGGRAEASFLLDIAKKLLDARDFMASKALAERALEADPLLDGVDWIMATADVLLAAQKRRINNHVDLYAILQVDPSCGRGTSAVRLQYSRLARLLHPGQRQRSDGFQASSISAADEAFKLVSDAWAVLSDPAKKELYDKEIDLANGSSAGGQHSSDDTSDKASVEAEVNDGAPFWTACTNCFNLYQYGRLYEGRTLLCQNCRKEFKATEMASPPPIVPGTDMYFCAWGLFPLGFPGGPNFVGPNMVNSANEPWVGSDASAEVWKRNMSSTPVKRGRGRPRGSTKNKNVVYNGAASTPSASGKSPTRARNKLIAKRPRKQMRNADEHGITSSGEAEIVVDPRNRGNGAVKEGVEAKSDGGSNIPRAGCSRAVEVSAEDLDLNFTIDIDATNSILDSLSTLPFLKDEEIMVCGKIPAHFRRNV